MHIEHLYVATRTRDVENAGTSDDAKLVINGSLKSIPFTADHRSRGKAGFAKIYVGDLELLPEEINYSIAAGGSDLWKLDHAAVWGQRTISGNIYPLGFGAVQGLSTDESEGVRSLTPPLVFPGQETTAIRRLLIVIYTHPAVGFPILVPPTEETGTNSAVNLQIGTASGLVVDYDLPDTPQPDLERGEVNYYIAPVAAPFTRQELTNDSIVLSIRGDDRWLPEIVAIFGIDTSTSQAGALVPLVHVAPWSFESLSTDPEEGVEFVHLPLAPMDDTSILPPYNGGTVAVRELYKRLRELEKRVGHYERETVG